MPLKYKCEECGTPLAYEGLCWRCKTQKERAEILSWSKDKIAKTQEHLEQNIEKLDNYDNPENAMFWDLLGCHDAITPHMQRLAAQKEVYDKEALYYKAPADVRDKLISALKQTESSTEASELMCCLAMQGDDKALETLLDLELNPRPWRKSLYVDPSSYAQCGGWTFNKDGTREVLNFDTAYAMVKTENDNSSSPVSIGRIREDKCPHCGGHLVDILVLDGTDERLKYLGINGTFTATCCPNCVGFYTGPGFRRYNLDGTSELIPSKLFDGAESMECYISEEDYRELSHNNLVLSKQSVPLFYGQQWTDVATIGGFVNWVQDWEYTVCPECGKTMKLIGQVPWDSVFDCAEGSLYIEFCPDCQIVSMIHQQT